MSSSLPPAGFFYRRPLPPPAIAFDNPAGRRLFASALAQGHGEGFFPLISHFTTQAEPAYCGLASVTVVLNALGVDPRRPWKGAWRWFDESMLDCCKPLEEVATDGITLGEAACLTNCNGAKAATHTGGTFDEAFFRSQVEECTSSGTEHLIVAYSRAAVMQSGDGHFSPVGAYSSEDDMVLMLDTARFKYPPHWVPLPVLFEAMQAKDAVTGRPRGFLRVAAAPLASCAFTLCIHDCGWRDVLSLMRSSLPELVCAEGAQTAQEERPNGTALTALLERICDATLSLSKHLSDFLYERNESGCGTSDGCGPRCGSQIGEMRAQLFAEMARTPLHRALSGVAVGARAAVDVPRLCMFMWIAGEHLFGEGGGEAAGGGSAAEELLPLLDLGRWGVVRAEVQYLRMQLEELEAVGYADGPPVCPTCAPGT